MMMKGPVPKKNECQFVTFYSYKGGTGRSMLVANVAWILASNGYRVLAIDWDLEAPGLHRYLHPFLKDKGLSASDGLIDALTEFVEAAIVVNADGEPPEASSPEELPSGKSFAEKTSEEAKAGPEQDPTSAAVDHKPGSDDPDWYLDYANLLRFAIPLDWKFAEPGRLDFIGPGRQSPSYGPKVNLFDWEQFYSKFAGAAFLDAAKRFMAEPYDYVLVDSRTGVSDTSGICTIQMPDQLVVCFTVNNQSIEGAHAVTAAAQEARSRASKLKPLITIPVPTRIDTSEHDMLELGRELARVRFRRFVPLDAKLQPDKNEFEKDVERYWGEVEVPYIAKYAFEEVLACFGDKPHLKNSILNSAEKVASVITGKPTELVPPSNQERAVALEQFARKPYITVLAEEFVRGLSTKDQQSSRRLFTRLVQPTLSDNATSPGVPAPVFVEDLPPDAVRLLDKAVATNLITMTNSGMESPRAELADNRLISAWPRYREWIDGDRPVPYLAEATGRGIPRLGPKSGKF